MPSQDTTTALTRLMATVDTSGDCWLWTKRRTDNGYGEVYFNGGNRRAHCLTWTLIAGSIPKGRIIGHTCDNRLCVRYADSGTYEVNGIRYERHGHLWLATPSANSADMAAKGRAASGEHNGNSRLTREAVSAIRTEYAQGCSRQDIANRYDVTPRAITLIVKRITWRG